MRISDPDTMHERADVFEPMLVAFLMLIVRSDSDLWAT